jgi:hypothetical protein
MPGFFVPWRRVMFSGLRHDNQGVMDDDPLVRRFGEQRMSAASVPFA